MISIMFKILEHRRSNKYHRDNCKRLQLILFVALLTRKYRSVVQIDRERDTRWLLDHIHDEYKRHTENLKTIKTVSRMLSSMLLSIVIFIWGLIWLFKN